MATKIKYKTQKEFDLSDGLDLPDFDFEMPKQKDNRSAISKVGKAAIKGAKETVFSQSTIEQVIRRGLPSSYGAGLDLMAEANSSIKSLYDTAAKEFKPTINQLKTITKNALPAVDGKLPKSLTDKLKSWTTGDARYRTMSEDEQRQSALTMELGTIFQAQQIQEAAREKNNEQRAYFQQGLEQVRYRGQMGQLDAMRQGIEKLASYQDAVTANYQKKSLELQFRQYFATADILATAKKSSVETKAALDAVVKNTGLPEYVKLTNYEHFKELARNKFVDKIRDSMFGGASDYLRKFTDNITKSIKEKIKETANASNMAADAAGMMQDGMAMSSDMGGDSTEDAGSMVGSMAASAGMHFLMPKIKHMTRKNGKIARGGQKLAYWLANAGQLVNAHLQDHTKDWRIGTENTNIGLNGIKRFLAENAPSLEANSTMASDSLMNLNKPAAFIGRTNKTIIEIIPGLLSHIHRELLITRTGNDKAGLLTYDFENNAFKDSKTLGSQIRESIVGNKGRESVKQRVDDLLRFLDKEGANLSDAEKEVLVKKVTEMGFRKKNTDASVLSRRYTWGKGPEAERLAKVMQALFDVDETTGKRKNTLKADTNQRKFSELVNMIPSDLTDSRARVQEMINSGQYDVLREAGIINKDGNLNRDQILQDMVGAPGAHESNSTPASRRARRKGLKTVREAGHTTASSIHEYHVKSHGDSEIIEQGIADLKEAIRKASVVDKTNEMATTLLRIEQSINNAAIMLSTNYSTEQLAQAKQTVQQHQRWWNRSVGSLLGSGVRGVGSIGKGIFHEGAKVGKKIDKLIGGSFGLTKTIFTGIKDTAAHFFGDIYVNGEGFPRMTRAGIKAGEYFDVNSGKVIKSLKDITGDVKDKTGKVVLEASQIKDAFMKGKGIRGIANLVGKLAGFGFGQLGQISQNLGGFYGAGFKVGKAILKGTIRTLIPVSDVFAKPDLQNPILYAWKFKKGYYTSRKTGKVLNHQKDIDGPVMEDGNIVLSEEQLNRGGLVDRNGRPIHFSIPNLTGLALRAGSKLIRAGFNMAKGIAGKLQGAAGAVLDAMTGIFSGFTYQGKKNLEVQKSALEVQREILSVLKERLKPRKKVLGDSDGDGIREGSYEDLEAKKKAAAESGQAEVGEDGKPVKKGFFSRAKGGLMGMLGAIAGAGGGGGKGGSTTPGGDVKDDKSGGSSWWGTAAATAAGLGAGKFGGAAMSAGRFGLGLLSGAGGLAMSAGGLALRAGLSIGGAALGLASTPVILTGLGLTAAYYGYKYLTKKRLEILSTARFAQYGFDASEDDKVSAVFGLEDMLEPLVSISDGSATIDESKMKLEDALDLFGVKLKDQEASYKWRYWYTERFKPVFLGHMAVIRNTHPGLKIKDVDNKLEPDMKLKYLEATSLPGVDYYITVSPFPGQKRLKATSSSVTAALDIAKTETEKEAKNAAGNTDANGKPIGMVEKAKRAVVNATVAAGAAVGLNLGKPNQLEAPKKDSKGAAVSQTLSASAAYVLLNKGQLSALQALRFRTYGLNLMDEDKVKALIQLEAATSPNVTFNKKQTSFNGDAEKVLDLVKGFFGVSGYRSPQGYAWMHWYKYRFLPTYLAYLQSIYTSTGKQDQKSAEAAILPKDQLTAANAIKGAVTPGLSGTSVWDVKETPWEGYDLNSDPDSVKGNMDAITELNKAQALNEVSKVAANQKGKIDQFKKDNPLPKTGNSFKDLLRAGVDKFSNRTGLRDINPSGAGVGAAGDYMPGQAIKQPGNGTGGDINAIPNATGAGWNATKGTIMGAAGAAGVDPKLLASMAGIESDFNPSAKAGSSSASGLFQFTGNTWADQIKRNGSKYGIAPGTPPTDARANALLAAEFVKENIAGLKRILKRPLTATDVYIAHLLGLKGATKFLQADPGEIGAKVVSADAAKSNYNIFYDSKDRALTCGEIYRNLTNNMIQHMRQAGVNDADFGTSSLGLTLGTATVIQAPKGGLSLKLNRDPSSDSGTFGVLTLPDGTSFQTLELAWRNNAPQKSCIPPGKYLCVQKPSAKFGQVYEVQGVSGRSGILIHAGNTAGNVDKGQKSDVSGCILLGMTRGKKADQPAVLGSREAVATFSQKLGGQTFMLEVVANIADQPAAEDVKTVVSSAPKVTATSAGVTGASSSATAKGMQAITAATPAPSSGSGASNGSTTPSSGYGSSVASASNSSPVRINDTFRGFNQNAAPSSLEVMAQAKAAKDNFGPGIDAINKTLLDQLAVQQGILDFIKSAASQMSMKKANDAQQDTSPVTASPPSREAVKAPVSMRR